MYYTKFITDFKSKYLDDHEETIKTACRVFVAIFFGFIISHFLALNKSFWVTLTIMAVAQSNTGKTIRRSSHRFVATIIGLIIGLILLYINNMYIFFILLIIFTFLAFYGKSFIVYSFYVAPMTIVSVLTLTILVPGNSDNLLWARLYDTALGVVIITLTSIIILPKQAQNTAGKGIVQFTKVQFEYLQTIIQTILYNCSLKNSYASTCKPYYDNIYKKLWETRLKVKSIINNNWDVFYSWRYEAWLKMSSHKNYLTFLMTAENIEQYLISLHFMSCQLDPRPNISDKILSQLKLILIHIKNGNSGNIYILIKDMHNTTDIINLNNFEIRLISSLNSYANSLYTYIIPTN